MAEAVVDGTPMSRFFCHKCSVEIERLLPDYTCPRCASGFIEELESGCNDSSSSMDISSEDLSDIDDIPSHSAQLHYSLNRIRERQETVPISVENFIHDFILNLSGAGLGHPVTQDGQPVLFLGNPGDYVWGQDGLDAIVTQLLNQLDGTGPPPLPRKQIDEIPTTNVTQSQVDSKLQCSVCWEDFKLSEPVRQLPCQHLYHAPCIIPWLELHGTCPICRQSLGDQNSAEANQDTVGPSLAALFRAANESSNTRTSSASSSGGSNNSSNNTTSEI
ncbi:E3 ubiquitin-protein ligase Iruka isoform X4 [Calliopsis andreniformis]|uniref:E3 ubiquitin-protein ligase Iruka isoform X4 n=1 Tax=Calliopsis andreniformis TaxID=337506 RepID=UPI003FCE91E2